MAIGNLVPWRWGALRGLDDDRSFDSFRTEMESLHHSIDRLFAYSNMRQADARPGLTPEAYRDGILARRRAACRRSGPTPGPHRRR